jgi:hypothetical protein
MLLYFKAYEKYCECDRATPSIFEDSKMPELRIKLRQATRRWVHTVSPSV